MALVLFAVVLLLLLVFILENSQRVDISYFGAHGHLPPGCDQYRDPGCDQYRDRDRDRDGYRRAVDSERYHAGADHIVGRFRDRLRLWYQPALAVGPASR